MGCFSFTNANFKADHANFSYDDQMKVLIPKEFGGGYILGYHDNYGVVTSDGKNYDLYEVVAFWNKDKIKSAFGQLKYDGEFPKVKSVDKYTDDNRGIGIDIACYKKDIDVLQFPLKIVDPDYDGTYEECENKSYCDPEQGCGILSWDRFNVHLEKGWF